jgi:dihydrolipoamide dehydrogenase
MENQRFDLIVIGGGPGGYVAALRASQLGLTTLLVEKSGTLGGTCLNVGCIPSKALLTSSEHFAFAKKEAAAHGIAFDNVRLDLAALLARKDKVVKQLVTGIDGLIKRGGIKRIQATGKVTAPGKVAATAPDGKVTQFEAASILLATGSVPATLPGVTLDGKTVVTSTEALAFDKLPEKLVVIGAGAIGLELGSVWSRLGAEVTVLEFLDRIAPGFDHEIAAELQRSLTKQGLRFQLSARVTKVDANDTGAVVHADVKGKAITFEASKVLAAVGRKPSFQDAVDSKLGLETDARGFVKVDAHFQTNIKGVYAIGDLVPGPMLAHKAEEEAVAFVERLAGKVGHVNYATIPGVIYTHPEAAGAGLTEEAAKGNREVRIGKFTFRANGRALASGSAEGFVKLIADAKSDRLLGAHIIGANASELVQEAVSVMEFEGTAEDLARTVHAHPTLSEAVKEAALAVDKRAIHMPNA